MIKLLRSILRSYLTPGLMIACYSLWGCEPDPVLTVAGINPTFLLNADTAGAPSRTAAQTNFPSWALASDSALWAAAAKYDSVFMVGLKRPGTNRGFYRGKTLIDPASRKAAVGSLRALHPRGVIWEDTVMLPQIKLRLPTLDALSKVRRLPFIDYIEPAKVEYHNFSTCKPESLTRPVMTVQSSNGGFDTLSQVMPRMGIPDAWGYSKGDGAKIGVTDSGVDHESDSPMGIGHFGTVDSQGRQPFAEYYNGLNPDLYPLCDHGTRLTNLAAAPRDGRGAVGIAYRANVVSDYFEDSPVVFDAGSGESAIYAVWSLGANVITMAWGSAIWFDSISDLIDNLYYNHDVVFVGAAGTCFSGTDYCPHMESAAFPAAKGEVLAATGSTWEGARPNDNFDYGTKIEGVLAYTQLATTGFGPSSPADLNGSSAATGVIGGVAALVRSRYPAMSNHDVVHRILDTEGDKCRDPVPQWRNGMVNAVAALGGPCLAQVVGPRAVGVITKPAMSTTVTFSASATGDNSNSYQYLWSNNAHGQNISYTFYANSTWTPYYASIDVVVTDPATGVQVVRVVNVYVNSRDPGSCGHGGLC
jgi:hypothetical protein